MASHTPAYIMHSAVLMSAREDAKCYETMQGLGVVSDPWLQSALTLHCFHGTVRVVLRGWRCFMSPDCHLSKNKHIHSLFCAGLLLIYQYTTPFYLTELSHYTVCLTVENVSVNETSMWFLN